MQEGQLKTYETKFGKEEAILFDLAGKEHWVKRSLCKGRYQICNLLGVGGVGCVFLARDRWNYDHRVAIKTPHYSGDYCLPYASRSQTFFEKQIKGLNKLYDREKKLLNTLSNAGFDSVTNLNDYFFERNLELCKTYRDAAGVEYSISEGLREQAPYLVMRYVQGKMLKDIIEKKHLGQIETLYLARQLLLLMDFLHKARKTKKGNMPFYYLLCDLKAENILITKEEQVSLIDFGAIKIYKIDQGEIDIPIFVTDGYAAPEVYSGSIEHRDNPRIDKQFDIFTVGALMCHCLTSQHPQNFLQNTNPPQHNFNLKDYPYISNSIQKIIATATASNRKDRYVDVQEMIRDIAIALEEILAG